jgi:hypothetical protein
VLGVTGGLADSASRIPIEVSALYQCGRPFLLYPDCADWYVSKEKYAHFQLYIEETEISFDRVENVAYRAPCREVSRMGVGACRCLCPRMMHSHTEGCFPCLHLCYATFGHNMGLQWLTLGASNAVTLVLLADGVCAGGGTGAAGNFRCHPGISNHEADHVRALE